LLFGLKGAIGRLVDGMLAARRSRKVFERGPIYFERVVIATALQSLALRGSKPGHDKEAGERFRNRAAVGGVA